MGGNGQSILSYTVSDDAFVDLEMPYDTIDRHGMWQMLRVYNYVELEENNC